MWPSTYLNLPGTTMNSMMGSPWADVKAVVFDAVGTLLHPDPPFVQVYVEIARRYGVPDPEPVALRNAFRRAFAAEEARDREGGWRTSEERERQRWQTMVAGCLPGVGEREACFLDLFTHFADPGAWRIDPDVPRLLEALAVAGKTLGLASNYDARLRSVLAGRPELRLLEHIVISSELGWRKPAREFFLGVSDCLRLEPAEILFVGDDLSNDFEGATDAGLKAVLYDPEDRHPSIQLRLRGFGEGIG
jgi:putative hydrolase of the HAD superfamily